MTSMVKWKHLCRIQQNWTLTYILKSSVADNCNNTTLAASTVISLWTMSQQCHRYEIDATPFIHHNISVHGAPLSAANRLHGQRTGGFSWRPVLRLSCGRPTNSCLTLLSYYVHITYIRSYYVHTFQSYAPERWCDRLSSVYHLALGKCSGNGPTCDQPLLALSGMHTNHHLHPCPHPNHRSHG